MGYKRMSNWRYIPNLSFPGYGHIEPISDAECELIPEWQAELIVSEVNQLRGRVAELEARVADLLDALEDALSELETMSYARYASLENKMRAAIANAKEGQDDE